MKKLRKIDYCRISDRILKTSNFLPEQNQRSWAQFSLKDPDFHLTSLWDTFAKILYLSRIGENYLTIVGNFFSNFIKISLFGRDDGQGLFKVAKLESFEIIEVGLFLGAPGPFLAQSVALSWEQLTIQAQWSYHGVSHLNCSKGWCSFAKILKSSKIGENAFAKGFFSAILFNDEQ